MHNQFHRIQRVMVAIVLTLAAAGSTGHAAEPTDEATGTLEVFYADDFVNGHAALEYFLKDETSGRRVKLRFANTPHRTLRSGDVIKVRGRKHFRSDGDELEVAAANDVNLQTLATAPATVAGEQHALVLLINFTDAPLECFAAAVQQLMFGAGPSVAGLYEETSFGNVWLTGDVVGPYTINYYSGGGCDYSGWAAAAEAAAIAQGVSLGDYNRRIYVLPNANTCSWAGLGTVGGNPSKSWIAYCHLPDVYAHELGHNLTLHHASTDLDNNGVTDDEYGDLSDFMGYGGVGYRQLNSAHKAQLGWLPAEKLLQVTGSGVFQLAPLAVDPSTTPLPQTLVVTVPGSDYSYYLSYRRPLGYDADLYTSYANRLNIHRSRGGVTQSRFIRALTDGASFTDAAAGLVVTQLSHADGAVTIQISYGCTAAAPTVSLSPASTTGLPGAPATFTFSLRNNDRAGCTSATFQLVPVLPAGWTMSSLPAALTVPADAVTTASLTVHPPLTATNGSYSVSIGVIDNFAAAHNGVATATWELTSPPPPAPTKVLARARRDQVLVRWRMPRPVRGQPRVTGYIVWRDGNEYAASTSRRFRDQPVAAGSTHTYQVTAVNALGAESAPSAASAVTVPVPAPR